MLVVVFQMNVMMAQSILTNNQQKNIDLKLKTNIQQENVLCKKINKNTLVFLENNGSLPTIVST